MAYVTEAEVEAELTLNITATTLMVTTDQLTQMMVTATNEIHTFLHMSAETTDPTGLGVIRPVMFDLLARKVLRARQFKEGNLLQAAQVPIYAGLTQQNKDVLSSWTQAEEMGGRKRKSHTYSLRTGQRYT